MRGKSLILLLLALGCGLVASVGITQVMSKRQTDNQTVAEMEKIVVAVKDLPMGDPINLEWVKLEDWPKDKVPMGAITQLEDVDKRRPKSRVFSGSPVLDAQLFGKGESDNAVGSHIPPGYRVVSIEAQGIISSGGLIRPGDRVDLLLCVQTNPSKGIHETSTRTILQDIKVFAVDGRFRLDSEDVDKVSPAKMVSLLLTPDQAQRVTLASELGTMRLALRSPTDQVQPKVSPSSPGDLFGTTDGARRLKEIESSTHAASTPAVATKTSEKLEDFLSFLRGQQNKQEQAPPPVLRPSFSMRVITGTEVKDIRLEPSNEVASADKAGHGFQVWKPMSAAVSGTKTEATAETERESSAGPSQSPVVSPPKGAKGIDDLLPAKEKKEASPNVGPREKKDPESKAPTESISTS